MKYNSYNVYTSTSLFSTSRPFWTGTQVMAIGVVEFSREGYKIRKVFAKESTYPKEIFEF